MAHDAVADLQAVGDLYQLLALHAEADRVPLGLAVLDQPDGFTVASAEASLSNCTRG